MKHDIDLFEDFPDPNKKDWYLVYQKVRNAGLLNIVFQGGTFGNFLRHFIDTFSKKTSHISMDPFTSIGTSHAGDRKSYSDLIERYHTHFITDNEGEEGLPVCVIMPSTNKHFLYLKQARWFRASDKKIKPDDLWKTAVGEMPEHIRSYANDIQKLYDIKEQAHFSWIPKFIVRDWYKLEFLQYLTDTYDYQWFDTLKNHNFFKRQKTHILDLETFFSWESFIRNITELDRVFELDLDFTKKAEMKTLFDRGLSLDGIRQECNSVEDIFNNETNNILTNLDVSMEAFIYAEIEKKHPDIQTPLTNRFFRDSEEIKQFIEHFPNWYRKANPNIG